MPANSLLYKWDGFPIKAQFSDCLETDFRNLGNPWPGVHWMASQVSGTLGKGEGWCPPKSLTATEGYALGSLSSLH